MPCTDSKRTETSDFYELIVERHRKGFMIITSNRETPEILTMMADPFLAQSATDRFQSAAYELVVEASPTVNDNDPDPADLPEPDRQDAPCRACVTW